MRLQVRRVDHQLAGLAVLRRKCGKDAVEHAEPAPADEAVVDCLVRTVVLQRVSPAQAVPDHEDDSVDDPAMIDSARDLTGPEPS